MATCPNCGINSRDASGPMVIEEVLTAAPLGSFSLSGSQLKFPLHSSLRLSCRCGWSIEGYIENDSFRGKRDTERFPPSDPPAALD